MAEWYLPERKVQRLFPSIRCYRLLYTPLLVSNTLERMAGNEYTLLRSPIRPDFTICQLVSHLPIPAMAQPNTLHAKPKTNIDFENELWNAATNYAHCSRKPV